MMHDFRRPTPHSRRKRPEEDNQRQLRRGSQATRITHAFKRPWPWVKQPARKRKLVKEVLEDECGRAGEQFWNDFFRCENPQYLTQWIVKRQKMTSPPKEQTAPITVKATQEEEKGNRDESIKRRWKEYQLRETGDTTSLESG